MVKLKTNPYSAVITRPSRIITPQYQAIPGREPDMAQNNAGGVTFTIDKWTYLNRFLILGTEGGTYYASETDVTKQNVSNILACIKEDGGRVVARVCTISFENRAPKNDPALFVMALVISHGDNATKRAVVENLSLVARIPTHLFQFVNYATNMRGWGRILREAVAQWYTAKDAKNLAYHMVKYQSRDGWSNRDMLRLSHAKPTHTDTNAVFHWVTKGWENVGADPHDNEALRQIWAFECAKRATNKLEIVKLITDYNLPRECIPTQFLNDPVVWAALLRTMPMTAMVRNLATMTRNGLLSPFSDQTAHIVRQLTNEERLAKARIHPLTILSAYRVYTKGSGYRSHGTDFKPVQEIVNALDEAFILAFKHLEPTNKRILLGFDVSSSMEGGEIAGIPGLTPRQAEAAMAMVVARTEPRYTSMAFGTTFRPVELNKTDSLATVMNRFDRMDFGGTDCSLPMLYALQQGLAVDAFVVYTDNETWAGQMQPVQALQQYRNASGIDARLIVVGMTATNFSIADPKDRGMLDLVGFDTAAPNIMSGFMKGEF